MRNLKVILDYDDVLNTCNDEALNRLGAEKGKIFLLDEIHSWGILNNELDERLKYFDDPDFMGNIPLRPGAKRFVYELSLLGVELFIATSCPSHCAGARVSDIIRNFPQIDPANILIGSRKDVLSADMILDDGYHNLESSKVKYPVLFRRPWNKTVSGLPAVENFDQFITMVKTLLYGKAKIDNGPKVISIIGPSGSGKTTVANALLKTGTAKKVKTYTTRKPRNNEADGYYFVDVETFDRMRRENKFIETSCYMGNHYGTAKEDVAQILEAGKSALLAVDINGALSMKSFFGSNALNLFLHREKEDCIRSILERNLSMDETVSRISSIDVEMRNVTFCDCTINNNGTVDDAVDSIVKLTGGTL